MYIWKQSFLKKLGNSLCLILLILNNSTAADEKMKEFSSLFSPALSAVQTKAFFLLDVDDSEKLEATFNRMSEQNYTDSNDINEDILLEFLFDESFVLKIGKPSIRRLVIIGWTIHSAKQLQFIFGAKDNKSMSSVRDFNNALKIQFLPIITSCSIIEFDPINEFLPILTFLPIKTLLPNLTDL